MSRAPHQVSVRADTYDKLKAHIAAVTPKHERHGALARLVNQLITSALDAQEGK